YPSQLCLIWFVYLGSRVCRQLPSDSTSRWTPLSLANGSYYQVRRRLSLPRHNTCPAHHKNPSALPQADGFILLLRSEEHTSELQSRFDLVCRLLLEKKNKPN